jgi:hypothetical protein
MIRPYLLLALIPLLVVALPATGQMPANTLFMTKLGPARATPLGGGCYFPIQVSVNMTWTGPTKIYRIVTNNFWLLITTPNVQITNSSASSYQNPNNLVRSFNLFPNIPVNMTLGFGPTCLPSVGVARLVYLDSLYNFTFALP